VRSAVPYIFQHARSVLTVCVAKQLMDEGGRRSGRTLLVREQAGRSRTTICAALRAPLGAIFRRVYEGKTNLLESSAWRRQGPRTEGICTHQGGGCGRAAHEFREQGAPGDFRNVGGEMTHEACTAPVARSVLSPPAVKDGDRITSLAYGPDGPERAGSGVGRRAGTQATLWGSPCPPGRGARRRPSIFGSASLPEPPRDFPRPPLRVSDLHTTTDLRPAPRASAGTRRGVPAAQAINRAGTPA
jgi:hypothetical protein